MFSCTTETEETIAISNLKLDNNIHLEVIKTNKESKSFGIFSNYYYGSNNSYTYHVNIKPGKIEWYGGSSEPKHILFSTETTYLHSLKMKTTTLNQTDTLKTESKREIVEVFQKHVDERYFFKLMGNAHWQDIELEEYQNIKQNHKEYDIPNDKELNMDSVLSLE